jgi:uncharacterized protein
MRFFVVFVVLFTLAANPVRADVRYPQPPAAGHFVVDEGGLLDDSARDAAEQIGTKLLGEKGIPLLVVTIPSLASNGAGGMAIEAYARGLFDSWAPGRSDHNYAVLLLVARDDRRARIELGAAWAHGFDGVCTRIMDTQIVPEFKAGRYASGVVAGVGALDKMARGEQIPSRPAGASSNVTGMSASKMLLVVGGPILAFAVFIGLMFRRALRRAGVGRGAAGGFWGSDTGFFGGGGFGGGGGSGGGFSGGGGASGSW